MSGARVFSPIRCQLGEGPLWHPLRNQLFWFDITGRQLHWQGEDSQGSQPLAEICSAAGWIDQDHLLIASETSLSVLDLRDMSWRHLVALEADQPQTRSNDGRADRQGGFWIGTMGKEAEPGAGAIYRYYGGELRKLYGAISIPNAICFSPDGTLAYWADTPRQQIMAQPLDNDGWPLGNPRVFIDLREDGLFPDGAVTDARGHLWNAQWGAGRIAEYDPQGRFLGSVPLPALHATCPAFTGPDLTDLICTSATQGLTLPDAEAQLCQGQTWMVEGRGPGLAEPAVIL